MSPHVVTTLSGAPWTAHSLAVCTLAGEGQLLHTGAQQLRVGAQQWQVHVGINKNYTVWRTEVEVCHSMYNKAVQDQSTSVLKRHQHRQHCHHPLELSRARGRAGPMYNVSIHWVPRQVS